MGVKIDSRKVRAGEKWIFRKTTNMTVLTFVSVQLSILRHTTEPIFRHLGLFGGRCDYQTLKLLSLSFCENVFDNYILHRKAFGHTVVLPISFHFF